MRIHGTTKRQVRQQFEDVERPALQPLPRSRFPFFHEARRKVCRDGHIEVAKAYYSMPPEYIGRDVWVRWETRVVRVFDDKWRQIAIHARTVSVRRIHPGLPPPKPAAREGDCRGSAGPWGASIGACRWPLPWLQPHNGGSQRTDDPISTLTP
ncbi:MAG UNVERIFIED_CONTAM: hypothetical protein LVR18_20180 [Planctomycetaceae bacterium]